MQTPKKLDSEKMEKPDIKEILLTHNNETRKEAQIKKILGMDKKKISNESLYNKILFNICDNNSPYTNFNKYGSKGFKLTPISTIFSDNIIIAGLVPIQEIPKKQEDENDTENEEVKNTNRFIKYYRNIIYNFLLANNVKEVKPRDIKLQGIRNADGEIEHINTPDTKTLRDF